METNFDNIQKLWQNQKAKEFDLPSLISQMKRVEKKQKKEWIIVISLTPITVIFLSFVLPWRESLLGTLSIILVALGMAWVIWLSAKSRLKSIDDSERYSNQEFIQSQLKKLKLRYTILRKHMISYGLVIALAINIGYLVTLAPLSLPIRIAAHVGATLFIFTVMWITIRRKRKKYDQELKPIIEDLERLIER
jgi:Flp pilus assembly protein TadB